MPPPPLPSPAPPRPPPCKVWNPAFSKEVVNGASKVTRELKGVKCQLGDLGADGLDGLVAVTGSHLRVLAGFADIVRLFSENKALELFAAEIEVGICEG